MHRLILLLIPLAACTAPVPRPDLTPMTVGTGFITDDCVATGRPPEPATRAAYLDAAESWLAQPDVRQGRFRPGWFSALTTADCGPAWLVWNTEANGAEHHRSSLFVLLSKGRLELLKLQTR